MIGGVNQKILSVSKGGLFYPLCTNKKSHLPRVHDFLINY